MLNNLSIFLDAANCCSRRMSVWIAYTSFNKHRRTLKQAMFPAWRCVVVKSLDSPKFKWTHEVVPQSGPNKETPRMFFYFQYPGKSVLNTGGTPLLDIERGESVLGDVVGIGVDVRPPWAIHSVRPVLEERCLEECRRGFLFAFLIVFIHYNMQGKVILNHYIFHLLSDFILFSNDIFVVFECSTWFHHICF